MDETNNTGQTTEEEGNTHEEEVATEELPFRKATAADMYLEGLTPEHLDH